MTVAAPMLRMCKLTIPEACLTCPCLQACRGEGIRVQERVAGLLCGESFGLDLPVLGQGVCADLPGYALSMVLGHLQGLPQDRAARYIRLSLPSYPVSLPHDTVMATESYTPLSEAHCCRLCALLLGGVVSSTSPQETGSPQWREHSPSTGECGASVMPSNTPAW